jgi:hypothetical protein
VIEKYESLFFTLGVTSLVLFLGSVVIIPIIISQLPSDYFVRATKSFRELNPLHMILRALKNLLGLLFLLSGLVMLFIPGQGILTILLGLSLLDFPGKPEIQLRLLRMPKGQKLIKWIRHKARQPPLLIPDP